MKRSPPTAGFIRHRSLARSVCGWALLLIWLLVAIRPLHAHGGGEIKIAKEPIGPYQLTVWLDPPQPQAGKPMHITVAVLGENEVAVLDTAVTINMIDQTTGQTMITGPATSEQATNKLFYEIDFPTPAAGTYEVRIQLIKEDITGQASFPIEIKSANNTNWFVIGLISIGAILIIPLYLSQRKTAPGS